MNSSDESEINAWPRVIMEQESYPDIFQLKARDLLVKNRTRLIWPRCRLLRRLILAY